jgi:hypothetical protein
MPRASAALKAKLDDASGSLERHGTSIGSARMAQMELTHVIRASSDAYAAGAAPMQIFEMQMARVAEAASFAGGSFGKFGAIMAGPWGMAITAGAVILLPLITRLFESKDAVGALVAKMKEQEEQAALNQKADDIWKASIEGLTQAMAKQRDEQEKALKTDQQTEQDALNQARANTKKAQDDLAKIEQSLASKRVQLRTFQASPTATDYRSGVPDQIKDLSAQIKALDDRRTALMKGIAAGMEAVRQAEIPGIERAIGDRLDKAKAATDTYTAALGRLRVELQKGQISEKQFDQQLDAATRTRDAAIKAAQAEHSSANRQTGRQITLAEGRDIVHGIGGTITSDHRSYEQQAALYAKYQAGTGSLAAKPGTSMHEWDDAIDIAKTVGMSLAKIRKAFEDKGVHVTELLDEGDHFHVGWGKKGKSPEQAAREAETERQKQIARAEAYSQEESAAQRRLIDAQKKTADTAEERYTLAVAAVNDDADARKTQIANELAARKITAAQAQHLNSINEATRTQLLANAAETKSLADLEERVKLERLDLDNANAILRGGLDAAKTQAERRAIQLQMLDIEKQEAIAALDLQRQKKDMSDAEYARNRAAIDINDTNARAGVNRDTMGPWDKWLSDAPTTAAQVKETLESIKVRAIDDLNNGLAQSVASALKLHGALGQAVADLIEMVLKIAEANAAGKGGGGGGGGIFNSILSAVGSIFGRGGGSFGGGDAVSGGVSSGGIGGFSGVGESAGLGGFAKGGSFDVGGRGGIDRNILSINGVPRVRVSATERVTVTPANKNGPQPTVVQLVVGEGQMFEPRVAAISGNVSLQTVRQASAGAARAQRQSF